MSKVSNIEASVERGPRSWTRNKAVRGAGIVLALTTVLGACDKQVAQEVVQSAVGESNLSRNELLERYEAGMHAKRIETDLNKTKVHKGAEYYAGATFVIAPEHQEKYGFGVIYHPVALEGKGVGFFTYDGKGANRKVDAHFVDAGHGTFEPGYGPVDMSTWEPEVVQTDLALIDFDYTPDVQGDLENTLTVVVANDEVQTFIGQPGPMTTGPNQP